MAPPCPSAPVLLCSSASSYCTSRDAEEMWVYLVWVYHVSDITRRDVASGLVCTRHDRLRGDKLQEMSYRRCVTGFVST